MRKKTLTWSTQLVNHRKLFEIAPMLKNLIINCFHTLGIHFILKHWALSLPSSTLWEDGGTFVMWSTVAHWSVLLMIHFQTCLFSFSISFLAFRTDHAARHMLLLRYAVLLQAQRCSRYYVVKSMKVWAMKRYPSVNIDHLKFIKFNRKSC